MYIYIYIYMYHRISTGRKDKRQMQIKNYQSKILFLLHKGASK